MEKEESKYQGTIISLCHSRQPTVPAPRAAVGPVCPNCDSLFVWLLNQCCISKYILRVFANRGHNCLIHTQLLIVEWLPEWKKESYFRSPAKYPYIDKEFSTGKCPSLISVFKDAVYLRVPNNETNISQRQASVCLSEMKCQERANVSVMQFGANTMAQY